MGRRKSDPEAPPPSLGWTLIDWYETYLCHGPGDVRGQPLDLDPEFAAFIVKCYELDPLTGRRVVKQRAFLSRPKGRAKSEAAGMVSCGEALGPVRFDGWDANGEPVGRPVKDPFIRCLATEESQSGNTYDNVTVMLDHLSEQWGQEFPGLDIGRDTATSTRIFIEGGGEIRPSTASGASKDGGKETFAVFDETHLYVQHELREMHNTVTRNLTKRKAAEPWALETSTMYQPGQQSVAELTHDVWRDIVGGRHKNYGILFDHRQGPMPEDWDDDEQLIKALAEAYGPAAAWMDLEKIVGEIRDPKTTKAAACRYFLNRAVAEEERWVSPAVWDRLMAGRGLPEDGTAIALGFDGSESSDNTALVGQEMATGRLFVVKVWRPGPADRDGWQVPRPHVKAVVADVFRRWNVARMLCDPPYWRTEIADWQAAHGDKIVIEFETKQWSKMASAVERFDSSIRAEKPTISHDGDPILREHALNAHKAFVNARKPEAGFVLVKDRPNSPNKIDTAVAAVLANQARGAAIADGWKPNSQPFVLVL